MQSGNKGFIAVSAFSSLERVKGLILCSAFVITFICIVLVLPVSDSLGDTSCQDQKMVILDIDMNDDISDIDLILAYESVSAEKKHFEAYGADVYVLDREMKWSDPNKDVLVNIMKQTIGNESFVCDVMYLDHCPPNDDRGSDHDKINKTRAFALKMDDLGNNMMEPIIIDKPAIDVEFLEVIIEHIEENGIGSGMMAPIMKDILDRQKAIYAILVSLIDTDYAICTTGQSLGKMDLASEVISEDVFVLEEEDVVIDDNGTEETVLLGCISIRGIFGGVEPIDLVQIVDSLDMVAIVGTERSDI